MKKSQALASARAFLHFPFDILVDMLSLEPHEDWHGWQDSDGNRLRILKNGRVNVYPSKQATNKTTDVFRKAKPELIARHSYWGMLLSGKDNILIFLGNDGRVRCSYFKNNIWYKNLSPLLLGFDIIRYIVYGYLETNTVQIKPPKISYPHDIGIEEAWAFGFPIENNQTIKEHIRCLLKNLDLMD
jgi:hypothetical protein